MKEEKIEIRPLDSADAKNQLINSLDKIDGVKHASINAAGDIVKISYTHPTSAKQIEHCIRGAGNKIR